MQTSDYLEVLKRTGIVLLIVGVLDIGYTIYCIFNGVSYQSSLNIFAVIGGIFLIKGNLRAASIVRWLAVFTMAATLSMLAMYPFTQSSSLLITTFRLNAIWMVWSCFFAVIFITLMWWLAKQLSMPSVLQARELAGKKKRNMYVPAAIGIALATILSVTTIVMQRSDSAKKALALVEEEIGPNYQYTIDSINFRSSSEGKVVSGVVTAWNSREIQKIPFQWKE